MSISTPLLITSVVFSIAGFPSCFSANQQFEECLSPPLRCGSGPSVFPNITYPFWGNNIGKPNFCGQTEFELSCKENQSLTLEIENLTLRVISANIIIFSARTDNRTITVADESLFEGGCPKILNFKGDDKFSLNPTTETIDLFLCSSGNPVESSLSTLTCQESNKNMTTYHVFGSSNPAQNCDKIGEIPMLGSAKNALHQSNESNQALKMALEKGFELKYKIENQICRDCALSSGICGSDSGSGDFRCLCADKIDNSSCYTIHGQGILSRVLIIGVCVVSAISMSIVVMGSLNATERSPDQLSRCITRSPGQQPELKAFNQLKQYSYAQVTIITRSFAEVVGRGGFGTVYRGTFSDGRMVAVKVLKDSMGDGEDFINEIESMSETSHVNIVTLLGFCSEGTNKAIIYEFLENGSLDQFISSNTPMNTDWTALYGIALGVARGLEYLHHGCRTRIVHFDIKPQNVLLDDNLCPKVSDFGLAKLCERKSILSLLGTRGTIGYIAPKLFSRMYGRDSHKSDVYSYGMMVLEMIGARNKKRAAQNSASNASSMYFPEWIYKDLEKGDSARLNEDTITCEEEEIARKMTLVGLWCIQPSPSDRPPMNRVVEMMEGSVDALEVPPRPVFQIPTATFQESSTFSEDISVCTEYDP